MISDPIKWLGSVLLVLTGMAQSAWAATSHSDTTVAAVDTDSSRSVVVRSVTLIGNVRTRDRIVFREMTLKTGDTVLLSDLPGRLTWDRRNISNTNLFITVDLKTEQTTPTDTTQLAQLDLTVRMKERWYLIAYPVFDIADRNLNEWWYDRGRDLRRTIYGGRLSYRNVTGSNDRLQVEIIRGFWQRTVLSYARPYIDKAQRIGLRVDVGYQTNNDIPYTTIADKWRYVRADQTLRSRTWGALTLTNRHGLYHYHSVDIRYSRNTVADTVVRLNPDYFLDNRTEQRYASLAYGYRYDRRDNVAYPLRGTLFLGSVGVSGLLPSDNFRFLDVTTSVSRYWPMGKKVYGAANLRARTTWPDRQPYFNLHGIGNSTDNVRGYELYVIDGQHSAVARSSFRYQLFDTVKQLNWLRIRQFNTLPIAAYITAFADAGYVGSTVAEQYQSRLANQLLVGTGLSFDLVTYYNLVIRLSGAINRQGNTGFYFNFAQEF
ncbi:BamA/TamA family outer membrane protein [Spirosoma rhododendri]|uniref:BamA/TamA family outer membrane protein n=1 Tax=Spirosoma rhododendri TaxID=2728024 RepID=A0A7L5DS93_9BACT|nr:BamA/TamA family outer membrane protein [Spirosoma rhododendri]QJD78817.1 BamA/TamA family outer membrane protein [Spirosoma rhododendri]